MNESDGIRDPLDVSPTLLTGGQPTATQLQRLAELGVAAVINLGLLDPAYCLDDEAGLVAALGMEYHHIPVDFRGPRQEQFLEFVERMDRLAGKRTFVHCAANKRVSCFVALYLELRAGWSAGQGDALIRRVWTPDEVWSTFVARIRSDRGLGEAGHSSPVVGGGCVDGAAGRAYDAPNGKNPRN